jgi:hypothetical protein
MISILRRILRVLSSPSRLKRSILWRLQPRLRRLMALLLPDAANYTMARIEAELAEARYSILKLEAHEHMLRVGSIGPAPQLPEPQTARDQP